MKSLDLARLREVNSSRCKKWHPPGSEPWSFADWSNAMCGEAGEAANVVKKIRRHETGAHVGKLPLTKEGLISKLAGELADTLLYVDLLADHAGIDLAQAVVDKFNQKSEEMGFPERL